MANNTSFGTVCAVVVTYNIGNAFDTCFNSLKGQVDHVVIVNTSTDDGTTSRMLARVLEGNSDFVHMLECPENNLGMAQNMGIAKALELGHDWVLLLDHDSRLRAGMISAMESAYAEATDRLHIGLLAPYIQDPNVDDAKPKYLKSWGGCWFAQKQFDDKTPLIDNVLCVPASGSLIPASMLEDEAPMDEGFIVDCIDTDFCLRMVKKGYRIMAVRDAKLSHKIGERRKHEFLGVNFTATHHAPRRRYYLFRNRLMVWKRYGLSLPSFLIFDMLRAAYEMWRILLVESEKGMKINHMLKGLLDGSCGLAGPMPGEEIARAPIDESEEDAA